MKVAVVIDTWFPFIGGGQINALEVSKRISSARCQIDLITRNNGSDKIKNTENFRIIKLGKFSKPDNVYSKIWFQINAIKYLMKNKYDLINAYAFLPGLSMKIASKILNTPVILTIEGTSLKTNLSGLLKRRLEKLILLDLSYNWQITDSQEFLEITKKKNITYIPNGIEIKIFENKNSKKHKKEELLFVGRLHPQKNLLRLIQAVKILTKKYPNIKLNLVGSGPQKQEIAQLIGKLKLKNNVKLLGQILGRRMVNLYKNSTFLVLPSIYEGQPLTLLEAWACKLPVITSMVGDCKYVVKNEINGYLIKNQLDPNKIALTIEKGLKNKNISKMGLNGYKLVKLNYSWNKTAMETLKIYEKFN